MEAISRVVPRELADVLPTSEAELSAGSARGVQVLDGLGECPYVTEPEVVSRGDRDLALGLQEDPSGAHDFGNGGDVLRDDRNPAGDAALRSHQ